MKRYTEKTLREYIREHSKWGPKQREERLCFFALAMCGETGELANFVKKAWRGDFGSLKKGLATLQPKLVSEAADVGAYAMMFLDLLSGGQLGPEVFKKFIEVEGRAKYQAAEAKRQGRKAPALRDTLKPALRIGKGRVARGETWDEVVRAWVLETYRAGGNEFVNAQLYASITFSATHPDNNHVEAKLRQTCQHLVKSGELERVKFKKGHYRILENRR